MGQSKRTITPKKEKKKSIWLQESLQLGPDFKPYQSPKTSTILKPKHWTPGAMAHRYSPFWELRKKRSQVQTQWSAGEIPALLISQWAWLGCLPNVLSGFGLLVLFCCASEKIRKLKKKKNPNSKKKNNYQVHISRCLPIINNNNHLWEFQLVIQSCRNLIFIKAFKSLGFRV
jgi:hypothetical protein